MDLEAFARDYTEAWCSQDPARVARHYAPEGSLTINDGTPAVGRAAITEAARSFMVAFPDLRVELDGRAVRISGYEEWTIGDDGLIASSRGHYDQADWDRQVEGR